jgi:hypothetical protein
MNTLFRVLLTFVFLGFSIFSHAEDIRYYDVEIILFENLDNASRQSENWPNSVELVLPETIIEIGRPYAGSLPQKYDPALTFQPLSQEDYQLQNQARKIEGSSSRRVLLHTAWRQPGMDREEAMTVYFKRPIPGTTSSRPGATGAAVEPVATSLLPPEAGELEGMIKVTLSRYLHVDTDIVFRPRIAEEPQNFFTMDVTQDTLQPVVYRLKQTRRRIRSRELHYLDNPVLGMLVLITPYTK